MKQFSELVVLFEDASNHYCYLLIDAAQEPALIEQWLNGQTKPKVRSLFENTLEQNIPLSASPILYQLNNNHLALKERMGRWLEQSTCVNVIMTRLNVDELIEHLQSLLYGKLPSGEEVLFRFYDPTVACVLPNMLPRAEYDTMMHPIANWWYANDEGLFEALPKKIGGN